MGEQIMLTDSDIKGALSNRTRMWIDFARKVADHVECYTIPQYGDYPEDQLTEWTLEDIKTTIKRYANRIGTNARGPEDQELDMLKIAHYASVAYLKLRNEEERYNSGK